MRDTICREIRRVEGGWIVEMRWPWGGEPGGFGEVICGTWDEVVLLLAKALPDDRPMPAVG